MFINSFPNSSTSHSPHYVVYGYDLLLPVDLSVKDEVPVVQHTVTQLHSIWSSVQASIRSAQQTQKRYADRRRRTMHLDVGQEVLLSTRYLDHQVKLGEHTSGKLMPRYVGPFKLLERVGPAAWRLELP